MGVSVWGNFEAQLEFDCRGKSGAFSLWQNKMIQVLGSGLVSKGHCSLGPWRKYKESKNSDSNTVRRFFDFMWLIAFGVHQISIRSLISPSLPYIWVEAM